MSRLALLVLLLQCAGVFVIQLPEYFRPCSRTDPELRKCCIERGNEFLPEIMKGVKELNIPRLSPMKIPEVSFQAGANLNFKFTDVTLTGLGSAVIKDVMFDFDAHYGWAEIYIPKVNFVGNYDISGRILLLPINGNGVANITYEGVTVKASFGFSTTFKNGEEYLVLENVKLGHVVKHGYYNFANLFNGDETLGKEMNKFLNENWEALHMDIGPAVSAVIERIATKISAEVAARIPYNELFLK